jgi:pimeloyl-ACP methyl ester carboxylesterase
MVHPAVPPPSPGDLHDEQVVALLRSGAHASLLAAYFGEPEYHELCQLAQLATNRLRRGTVVYILPGIMGSKLAAMQASAANVLWLHPAAIAAGGMLELALPRSPSLQAVGVMLPGYLKMKLRLEIAGFEPRFYPFDWREDLLQLGRQLMQEIETTSSDRVALVAHSMGGLVARAALSLDTDRRISQLIQLGVPNQGSFAPVQALRAVYPTVRKIAALDLNHSAEQLAARVFRTLPGLYQMLPAPQAYSERNFFDVDAWPSDAYRPDSTMLQQALDTRSKLADADERCSLIAGIHQETITGVSSCDSGLAYTFTHDGDGTVPLHFAIWPGARTWYLAESHGALAANDSVLTAVIDLLEHGDTSILATTFAPPSATSRCVTDGELRTQVNCKVRWDTLSIDTRRRILEPVISPEFAVPTATAGSGE